MGEPYRMRPPEIDNLTLPQVYLYLDDEPEGNTYEEVKEATEAHWKKVAEESAKVDMTPQEYWEKHRDGRPTR